MGIEKVQIGDALLFRGDCLEVMQSFPECFRVDAVICDPPYGVAFKGKTAKQRGGGQTIGTPYASFEDTEQNHAEVVLPAIKRALELSKRAA